MHDGILAQDNQMENTGYKFTYIIVYQYFTGPDATIGNIDYLTNEQISTAAQFSKMQDAIRKSAGKQNLAIINVMRLPL